MFTFLVVLILITASLLVLMVLVQNSKKEGLGNVYFGDTGASQLIGVKKTSDLLEQITWGLVIALFVLTFATSFFLNKADQPGTFSSSPNISRIQERSKLTDEATPDSSASSSDTAVAD